MSLIWSLSGVISYKDETSANFTVLKDRYQYFQEGPDVSALPEIVALMTDLGLPTKTAEAIPARLNVSTEEKPSLSRNQLLALREIYAADITLHEDTLRG